MRNRGPVSWLERFERHAHRTFAEAGAKYFKEYPGTERGKDRVAYALKGLNQYIGDLVLMDVNNDALAPFKDDMRGGLGYFLGRPQSAGTINYSIGLANTIMRAACQEYEWSPRAPKLKFVVGPRKLGYPLTWAQQDALFHLLPEKWANGVCLFMVNVGPRPEEVFGLKWTDEERIPSLNRSVFMLHDTKNGEARPLICNSLAMLAVDRQRENGSEYVFPSESRRTLGEERGELGKAWYSAWKAAGLPTDRWTRRGPYNLRHTFATRLRDAGISEEDRDLYMGHKRRSISQHYAMPVLERLVPQLELITRRTEGVILRRVVA
jgi:integrase